MPDRKYGQDEIQRILRKAAEKQQRAHEVRKTDVGLSLEEIERIASEAGIDPRFVREAASESSVIDDTRKHSSVFGGILSMNQKRSIPTEIPESKLDTELVPLIRDIRGKPGQFEKLGQELYWTDSSSPEASHSTVRVTSKNGKTDISVATTKNYTQTVYALGFLPAFLMLFAIAGIAKNGIELPTIIISLTFLVSIIAARIGFSSWANRLETQLDDITTVLEDAVVELGSDSAPVEMSPSETAAQSDSAPRLSLEDVDEEYTDHNSQRNRERS